MKKKVFAALLLVVMALTLWAGAAPRYSVLTKVSPRLSFTGATANCAMIVEADAGTSITATMTLYDDDGEIQTWTAFGKTSITVSKPCGVTKGQTYTLEVTATAGGETTTNSVTATCN